MDFALKSKVVLITGGGRGIGRAAALRCLENGAAVVICSRTADEISETVELGKKFENGGEIWGECCDVSEEAQVKALVEKVAAKHGAINGLVCCSAITGGVGKGHEISAKQWEHAFKVNVFGTLYCIQAAVPVMKRNGGGKIVLFGGAGQGPLARRAPYAATKGAITRMAETFAEELKDENIFVNAVLPGPVNTKFLQEVLSAGAEKAGSEEYERAIKQQSEGGTSPELAADLVAFLLSDQSLGLYGKTLSARWDKYKEFSDLPELSKSDRFTMRRVTNESGGTR